MFTMRTEDNITHVEITREGLSLLAAFAAVIGTRAFVPLHTTLANRHAFEAALASTDEEMEHLAVTDLAEWDRLSSAQGQT